MSRNDNEIITESVGIVCDYISNMSLEDPRFDALRSSGIRSDELIMELSDRLPAVIATAIETITDDVASYKGGSPGASQ